MAVAPHIRVELDDAAGGEELLEALSVRGLESRLVRADDAGAELEVAAPPERGGLWNLEVVTALEAWLEETERESVVARLDRTEFTVRAPRPLRRAARSGTDDPDATLRFDPLDPNRTAAMPAVALPGQRGGPGAAMLLAGAGLVVVALALLWVLAAILTRVL
jgi:hypothetical protein